MKLATDQVSEEEVKILLRELGAAIKRGVAGDVVELGCYEGGSAVELQRYIVQYAPDRSLWLYDSFEGLPEKTPEDTSPVGNLFQAGVLKATPSRLKRNFVKASLPIPEITRAWFYELDPEDLPERIALAFLDGDFYESIMDSLKLVWPKMSAGGIIVVDDYENTKLPGVKKALDIFLDGKAYEIKAEASLAIIQTR